MPDASTTAMEMDAKVPADHPLRVLARLSAQPLEDTVARLMGLDTSLPKSTLQRALRAVLLQAFYSMPDQGKFADQIHFNRLFRWYIGLEDMDEPWDAALYAKLHQQWTHDQELRPFFELVMANAFRTDTDETRQIAASLEAWLNRFCPKTVYFHQFGNSPIKDVRAMIRLRESNSPMPKNEMPPAFWQKLNSVFPQKAVGERDLLDDWQEFKTADGTSSVSLNAGAAFLLCAPQQFESWEDSAKPILAAIIDAYKAIDPAQLIQQAVLGFHNRMYLPAEIELLDYFHMLPNLPPNVVPPRYMRENNLAYAFPDRMMKGSYSTDLLYESGAHFLRCSFELEPAHQGLQVDLDLELHWHQPFVLNAAMSIFDGMKNNLYVAFHSLITDQTRRLFE